MTGTPDKIVPVITTLAEYQTRFWLPVARRLTTMGLRPYFVSFDDRSTDMLRAAALPTVSVNEGPVISTPEREALFRENAITRLAFWTSHERFAFERNDDDAMHDKLARSVRAAREGIALANEHGTPTMVQEVGGFLSVLGSWFAARARGIDHVFIEPSFFRGRLLFTRGDLSAPAFPASAEPSDFASTPPSDPTFERYVRDTLNVGQIVIPSKDTHHYRAAWRKVANARNLQRLITKSVDKYLLGKQQEFGHIGQHARLHLRMMANSRRMAGRYNSLVELGKFIYFPLHVPGDVALTLRSSEYLDQLGVVDYLCRHLPDGVSLAIKEHPAMVGMMEPARLIALLARHPRLKLIDPGTNNYEVIRAARGIVTINSKTGAEAGLIGQPVLVLGDAFYREAPFAKAIDDLSELPETIARMCEGAFDQKTVDGGQTHTEPDQHTMEWFARIWDATAPGELYATHDAQLDTFAASLFRELSLQAAEVGRSEEYIKV